MELPTRNLEKCEKEIHLSYCLCPSSDKKEEPTTEGELQPVDIEECSEHNNSSPHKLCSTVTICVPCIAIRERLEGCWQRWGERLARAASLLLFLLFLVYVGFAFRHDFGGEPSLRLLVVTLAVVAAVARRRCRGSRLEQRVGRRLVRCCLQPCWTFYEQNQAIVDGCAIFIVVALILAFIIIDVVLRRPEHLVSAAGVVVLVSAMFVCSHNPREVKWRPVCWGLLLQFTFAFLVLRTPWGRAVFTWMSARMRDYMDFTESGTIFVFGESYHQHFVAFRVMSTIIFFSATIAILYYLGALQVIIRAISRIMCFTMATGGLETFHAAVNIFCGWAESIMVVRPVLDVMTKAELHTIMTNGFATVAGGTLAAYILFGVDPNHLIAASFMSAPAALAMSKLFYPDSTSGKKREPLKEPDKLGSGIVDAATLGAVSAVSVVSHIVATIIAFISLLTFLNAALAWFGDRVGLGPPLYPQLTFSLICSYLFWPLSFLLGVPAQDCRVVARLLGVKIFVNEFVAYVDLGKVRGNRLAWEEHLAANGTWTLVGPGNTMHLVESNWTLVDGMISPRAEMLATYALCGFSDLMAMGMMCAALSSVAPSRRQDLLQVAPRALVSGVVACLLTAAMAGLVASDSV